MSRTSARTPKPTEAAVELWAELADHTLVIAREIQVHGYEDERAVPLTPSEGMVMRHLINHGDAAPIDIAAAVGLRRTNLSTALTGLERKALIERQPVPEDARRVLITITDEGRTNYAIVRHEWARLISTGDKFSHRDLDAARTVLAAVAKRLVSSRPVMPGPETA